jgi:hypothetical protein
VSVRNKKINVWPYGPPFCSIQFVLMNFRFLFGYNSGISDKKGLPRKYVDDIKQQY